MNSMVAAVVAHWHLPLDEVRSWTWGELQRAHSQVNRERYDSFVSQATAVESGQVRAYIATHGKQPQPYKSYDDLNLDPWERRDTDDPADDVWTEYRSANDLEH